MFRNLLLLILLVTIISCKKEKIENVIDVKESYFIINGDTTQINESIIHTKPHYQDTLTKFDLSLLLYGDNQYLQFITNENIIEQHNYPLYFNNKTNMLMVGNVDELGSIFNDIDVKESYIGFINIIEKTPDRIKIISKINTDKYNIQIFINTDFISNSIIDPKQDPYYTIDKMTTDGITNDVWIMNEEEYIHINDTLSLQEVKFNIKDFNGQGNYSVDYFYINKNNNTKDSIKNQTIEVINSVRFSNDNSYDIKGSFETSYSNISFEIENIYIKQ